MFNQGGEIALFEKLKFNAVFYGEALAGNQKPNLMYMTTFSDLKSHDELWKAFGGSPEWKKISQVLKSTTTLFPKYMYICFIRLRIRIFNPPPSPPPTIQPPNPAEAGLMRQISLTVLTPLGGQGG